jgi:hypothetical protein
VLKELSSIPGKGKVPPFSTVSRPPPSHLAIGRSEHFPTVTEVRAEADKSSPFAEVKNYRTISPLPHTNMSSWYQIGQLYISLFDERGSSLTMMLLYTEFVGYHKTEFTL